MHPDKILIDSNEDGFEENNVWSICKVAASTKTSSQRQRGYIGEKGIGFKSVFKVASKVHIQSEPFSFFFEYSPGDGFGMITPFYEEHKELPANIRTRITLTLGAAAEYAKLVKDFTDPKHLPDSLLMFLTKLKKLTITIHNDVECVNETSYSYHYDATERRGKLIKVSLFDPPKVTHYHITKRMTGSLPKDALRPERNQAEAVLAFPVDSESIPVIEQQHVFAFLPVRQVGYSVSETFHPVGKREGLT